MQIFESRGDTQFVKNVEVNMALIKAQHEGAEPESLDEEMLKSARDSHERVVQKEGERSLNAISTGVSLGYTLSYLGHGIESDRLLTEQMRLSLQIHGRDHDLTKRVKLLSGNSQATKGDNPISTRS